ncbi:hypothetical protein SLE2022_327990 [Rubroshorea leprosula]
MPYDNIFVWNSYLTQAIRLKCDNIFWTIALVHGHFKQTRLSIFGRDFSVSLVSKCSRHFRGTCYLRRGVNDLGRVLNDVETEQIVLEEEVGSSKGKLSSIVQMRGLIPLFWSQEASRFSPKYDIILQRYYPTYEATKLHFEDLAKRYGNPIILLNLIKTVEQRPREMMLRHEFANIVGYLNTFLSQEDHLEFIHWDFHKFAKSKSANVLAVLGAVASEALDLTGFYYSGKLNKVKKRTNKPSRPSTGREASVRYLRASSGDHLTSIGSNDENLNSVTSHQDREADLGQQNEKENRDGEAAHFQSGILCTNCIDCLDCTNVAQYGYGLAALGHQLHAMGLTDNPKWTLIVALLQLSWIYIRAWEMLLHSKRQGKWKATTQAGEFLNSIKQYYHNAYTDSEKQDAINLFLGYFKPQEGKPALWELESDYCLHISGISDGFFPDKCSHLKDDNKPVAIDGRTLSPIPACREDFSWMKLTSLGKLIERTCTSIKDVRICSDPDPRPVASTGNAGVALAPDTA